MDIFTRKKRSWIMGRIRSKNTKPEIIVRSILHRMGFRFSLGRNRLPGSPDIVLTKHRTSIFVHGCFWHRHKGCKVATMPKSRVEFWKSKFERNVERDRKNIRELRKLGWTVIVVWECQVLRDPVRMALTLFLKLGTTGKTIRPAVSRKRHKTILYDLPEKKELMKIAEKRADYSHMGN